MTIPASIIPLDEEDEPTTTSSAVLSTFQPYEPIVVTTTNSNNDHPLSSNYINNENDNDNDNNNNEQEEDENNRNTTNNTEDNDDDDDMTVIILEPGMGDMDGTNAPGWAAATTTFDPDSPEMEERRRNVLLRELQRVQRASFIHFMILCLIPTSLLLIVIATVVGEDEDCDSSYTTCAKEARTFINAFTTRCICDAIAVAHDVTPNNTEP